MNVEVDGRVVQVSSLDRVLWPETGTTKAELLEHYLEVAPLLLPHLVARPVTLHRFPNGVTGKHFFQTRTPPHPAWVRTVTLSYERTGKTFEAAIVDDLASLVWAVNLTTIELHPFLGHVHALDRPTAMVLDLDPGLPAGMLQACRVALLLREELGGPSYVKTSGGKGLHLLVPTSGVTYEDTKGVARQLARTLTARHPDLVVDRMTKSLRAGRVLVDWSQNDAGKSTVAPWSVRGLARPYVSAPLTWDEVEDVVRTGDPRPLLVEMKDLPQRIADHGDLFAPLIPSAATPSQGPVGPSPRSAR
ncbi:MAG: non-homologous end-joining DNA ligase [Actinobacteria bacterium]|nr:non-homologous end-joining DNA ligase [Actinomycetota bacterium]MCA1722469.1 non-homologous end-joining DNA ligase [Actinomycetota bacterium]